MTMIQDKSFSSNELFFDEGCEYANSCLNCSLPLCKYDDPILDNSKSKINRNSLIFSMKKSDVSNKEIAKRLKISTRTVHRVLAQENSSNQKFVLDLRKQNLIKKSQLVSMKN
tara:strand:- start:305 stop:643 length:339 start_codon:yes stop_codon:yes gene_type:complete